MSFLNNCSGTKQFIVLTQLMHSGAIRNLKCEILITKGDAHTRNTLTVIIGSICIKAEDKQLVSGVSALSYKTACPIEAQAKCTGTGEQNSFVSCEGL